MSDTKTICRECGETITSSGCVMVACPKCSLIQYATIRPVKLSEDSSGECVGGCGEPAFAWTCDGLDGYVDACHVCVARVLTDALASRPIGCTKTWNGIHCEKLGRHEGSCAFVPRCEGGA